MNKNPEILVETFKIIFSNGEFSYRVLGSGPKKMVSFHGFGQDGLAYLPLTAPLKEYTIFSVELPFHGSTQIIDMHQPLSASQLVEIVSKLISGEKIAKFSLSGFSIGARLLFPVLQKYAANIDRVILIAPDGITENGWYRLATQSKLSRTLFRTVISSENRLNRLIDLGVRFNLLSKSTAVFAKRSAVGKTRVVYDTWCFLRNLRLNAFQMAQIINKSQIQIKFVLGRDDQIIRKKHITPLSSRLDHFELIELPCSHQGLIKKYSESLREAH